MAIYGAQGRVKDEAYLHHMYCKVENRIQGENQIIQSDKMCMCRDMMDMVRWILGLEWVLYITICIMNVIMMVRCTLGPEWVLVITIHLL
jgi:hypothetical protein